MTNIGMMPNYVFPTPPPEDPEYRPCRQMWGCLVQEQVERGEFQAPLIKDAVAAIMASEACKSHPATCACKVPNNPWTWHECVAELEPLGVKHSPKCQCGGYQICKQKTPSPEEVARTVVANIMVSVIKKAEAELAEKPWLKVGDCRCDAQYSAVSCYCLPGRLAEAKAKYSAALAAEPVAVPVAVPVAAPVAMASPVPAPVPKPGTLSRQSTYDYQHHVDSCPCGTCHKARVDSGTQEAYEKKCRENSEAALKILAKPPKAIPSGLSEDFAKNLFAAMGTPHDSKCPHALPFYACMSCSH
jgi:hypothetical protein